MGLASKQLGTENPEKLIGGEIDFDFFQTNEKARISGYEFVSMYVEITYGLFWNFSRKWMVRTIV